ncbi:MAG: cyclic pyranopterin monophosphate synthase MoaC [Eubacterium sp.]|nr:cyclic pyranopterin monophosphate synthase MoaC [Eubacterium sp.]
MKPELFAFSGFSGSGKTTLIEKLIPMFKARGLKVYVIKHDAHRIDIDHEGKDTYRFSRAGADSVMISSGEGSAVINGFPRPLGEMIESAGDADIIIVEGYKYEKLRKIGVATSRTDYRLPCGAGEYAAVVTDDKEELRGAAGEAIGCPVFHIDGADEIFSFMIECMGKEEEEKVGDCREFTHFDEEGNARMVNVSEKDVTLRRATAMARVKVNADTFELIKGGGIKKGDVLTVAQIAGIMGAKRTPELIPMCHPIITDGTDVRLKLNEEDLCVEIESEVTCTGRTGVEMEAICACSVAAMTVYDMCKAVQRDIEITDVRLVSKSGGVHGDYRRE